MASPFQRQADYHLLCVAQLLELAQTQVQQRDALLQACLWTLERAMVFFIFEQLVRTGRQFDASKSSNLLAGLDLASMHRDIPACAELTELAQDRSSWLDQWVAFHHRAYSAKERPLQSAFFASDRAGPSSSDLIASSGPRDASSRLTLALLGKWRDAFAELVLRQRIESEEY